MSQLDSSALSPGHSRPNAEKAAPDSDGERGRTHGLSVIFWLIEQRLPVLLAIPSLFAALVTWVARGGALTFLLAWLAVPLFGVVLPLLFLVYRSYRHDSGSVDWSGTLRFKDAKLSARWAGRKIPMEIVYEAYIAGELDFTEDLQSVLLRRHDLFRFCFTWRDVKFYFSNFLRQNLKHSRKADREDIQPVYDRGNDFYGPRHRRV